MALIFGNEGFEGAGYEETWGLGESGAGSLDEDYDTSLVTGAIARMQSQCLRASVTGGQVAQVAHNFGSVQPITYIRGDLIIESESGETALGGCTIINVTNGAGQHTYSIRFDETTEGNYQLDFAENSGGAFSLHNGPTILLGTAYLWEVQWDTTNDVWEFKVDGVSIVSGTMTGSAREFQILNVGVSGTAPSRPHVIILDNIAIDDTDYLGAFVPGGTTTPQAIAATSVCSASFIIGRFVEISGPTAVGVASLTADLVLGRTLAATAIGVTTLTSLAVIGVSIPAAAIGSAVMVAAFTFGKVLASTAIGNAVLTKVPTYVRNIASTAIGAVDFGALKVILKPILAFASPTPVMTQAASFFRTLAATSVGSAVVTATQLILKTIAATATGVASVATQLIELGAGGAANIMARMSGRRRRR